MKRIIPIMLVVIAIIVAMTGCDVIEGIIGHEHSGGTATCSLAAVCDDCGESYGDKLEHDYSEATCTAPKTCKNCDATEGEPLPHDYEAATCTEGGTCKNCGYEGTYALGHDYTEATCLEVSTCTRCGVTTGALGNHSYALVYDEEYHWYECAVCNATNNRMPHNGGEATCTSLAICTGCNSSYGEMLEHDYASATCTVAKTCKVCGTEDGAPLGHSYSTEYSYDELGHWYECSVCKDESGHGAHTGGEATLTDRAVCSVCNQPYGEKLDISIDWAIEALSPSEGSTFCLANSRIKTWYETFDYTTTDTDAHWLEADIFLPEAPLFTWSVGDAALYYKVFVADNAELVSAKCYLTSACELSVEHLCAGTTYYWYVDAVYNGYTVRSEVFSFSNQATPRTVKIDGVSNSRDIGGYITVDGLRIKQGMIYRSAKLDDITEDGVYTLLYELGIKTDLDLRGDRNDYYKNATHPVEELEHIVVACPWYSTGSNHIWMDDYNKAEFAKAVKVFADPDNYPIIFHCSLGRDRTGTLAMVLEGLLGLDENTLMMEYELSVFSYWGTNGSTKYNNGLRNSIHDTYLYISNNYEGDSFSEKVEDFLLDIGVTADEIASIKSIMLEEVE